MDKICTSIEQSKKLIELGIDVSTADMYYEPSPGFCTEPSEIRFGDIEYAHPRSIRSWSLSALLGLMPFQIIENNNRFGFYQVKGFNKQGETYRFGYKTNNNSFLFETSWYNDVVDAAFEMVCWLKDNGKI